MRRFKKFVREYEHRRPRLIREEPVHGSHARFRPKSTQDTEEQIQENQLTLWHREHDNDHLGKNENEVHEKLTMKHEDWLSHPHKIPLLKYTNYSHRLNQRLVNKAIGKPDQDDDHEGDSKEDKETKASLREDHHEMVSRLDKATATPLKHDLHVYHGLKGWHPGEEAKKGGGRVQIPSFLSTSISKYTAVGFAGAANKDDQKSGNRHVLHIHLKKGQHGIYMGGHGDAGHERETILPRNTVLKIHPKPDVRTAEGFDGQDHLHVWHATVEDHK